MARLRLTAIVATTTAWAVAVLSGAAPQLDSSYFDGATHVAIQYGTRPSNDAVARLERALAAGTTRLDFDARGGYLPSLLKALEVSVDTQVAVFSKTSLQAPVINPRNPRAIYFNDSVAVAWPRLGFIEVAAQDATQGVAFYQLEQRATAAPRFVRGTSCVTCHVSYATLNVPGMLVRSVATGIDGRSLPSLVNATGDHRTPFAERWAGWFVTGQTGSLRHLGNTTIANPDADNEPPVTRLESMSERADAAAYLSPHSDIAALLVFNHQMHMMNLLTRLGWEARVAIANSDPARATTIARAAADVVDYMLFVDEPPLPGPVSGTSGFAERFSRVGPRDRRGRSLRQLDLRTRTMRYPLSYMIYTEVFDALPREARDAVYARLWSVLSGAEPGPRYARLSAADRQAILEILRETKPGLPSVFAAPST